VLLKHQLQTQS